MSLTVSRGLADAGRWVAVAATVAEYLDTFERAAKRRRDPPPLPIGAIEAARRFFRYVLEGIMLEQRLPLQGEAPTERGGRPSPSMAGFSNLSIAVNVMRSAQRAASPDDLGKLKEQIASLLQTLERLQDKPSEAPSQSDRSLLAEFLRELQRQGEIERDATFASQERPRAYPAPNLLS